MRQSSHSHLTLPAGSQSMAISETVAKNGLPYPSSSGGTIGPMMGSTASLVGMLKAAALNSFQNVNNPDEDDASSQSVSDSESVDGQSDHEVVSKSSQSLHSDISSANIQPGSSLDFQELQAVRVVVKRFTSTLLQQHSALQQSAVEGSYRFNSSPVRTQSQDRWSLANAVVPRSSCHSLPILSPLESSPPLSDQDQLQFVIDNFGPWSGTDSNGQPEAEVWISSVPSILTRSVLVQGSVSLTNRRLCYVAFLPSTDMGGIIRSGSVTLPPVGKFDKTRRAWVELTPDSLTRYKSSSKPFRPVLSLHLSQIKHILPLSPAHPKVIRLRLRNGKILFAQCDTAEATSAWHADFVNILFNFKTHHSNMIKIMIPLRTIRKLHRDTFENLARVMSLDIDCAPNINDIIDNDIIEEKFTHQKFDRTRVQLSYLLRHGNFDDLLLDAIARAKLEIRNAGPQSQHQTPPPLLKITTISNDEKSDDQNEASLEQTENIKSSDIKAFTMKFAEAFGLEENSNLTVYPCSLLRTLPCFGHVAISKDHFCFWHRGIPIISSDYKLKIPLKHIRDFKPTSSFGFHRYGLAIEVVSSPDIRIDFTSKAVRETMIGELKAAVEAAASEPRRQASQTASSHSTYHENISTQSALPPVCNGNITVLAQTTPIRPLRIVCLTIGSRGDVQPYISLAKRLMQDGHTVTIASHPEYREWVESFGILYKDVGGDPAALMSFSVEHSFFSTGFFKEGLSYFKTWLENLFVEAWVAVADSQAELLIESPSTFSGIHIAEALCIPYFRAFTMTWTSTAAYPQAFASSIDLGPSYNLLSYSLFDTMIWRAMSRLVNRWRKDTLHIPPTSLEKMQAYKVPFMYNFSSAVVPKPLEWRDHVNVTGYWFLDQSQKNFVPPEPLVKFIASARNDKVALVYVGFGSVTVPDSRAVTESIYRAVVQAGVRAVVAKGWSDRLQVASKKEEPLPPPEVYVLDAIPHDWLFPQMDAVCHHGGAGTTGISLRFGLPTIIHPFFGDQTFWADRVSRLGAGVKIDSLSVNALSDAFRKATSDRIIREKATQVKERIQAEDGPSRAVEFIYQYLDFALERTQHRIERTKPKSAKRAKSAITASTDSQPIQDSSTRSRSSILFLQRDKRRNAPQVSPTKQAQRHSSPAAPNHQPLNLDLPLNEDTSNAFSTVTAEPQSVLPLSVSQPSSSQETADSTTSASRSPTEQYLTLSEVGRVTSNIASMTSPVTADKRKIHAWSVKRLTR